MTNKLFPVPHQNLVGSVWNQQYEQNRNQLNPEFVNKLFCKLIAVAFQIFFSAKITLTVNKLFFQCSWFLLLAVYHHPLLVLYSLILVVLLYIPLSFPSFLLLDRPKTYKGWVGWFKIKFTEAWKLYACFLINTVSWNFLVLCGFIYGSILSIKHM